MYLRLVATLLLLALSVHVLVSAVTADDCTRPLCLGADRVALSVALLMIALAAWLRFPGEVRELAGYKAVAGTGRILGIVTVMLLSGTGLVMTAVLQGIGSLPGGILASGLGVTFWFGFAVLATMAVRRLWSERRGRGAVP